MLRDFARHHRNHLLAAAGGAAVGALAALFALVQPAWMTVLERVPHDAWQAASARSVAAPKDVVVVEVGDQDLQDVEEHLGMSWPWHRALFGHLVTYASKAGARAVVFDWVFEDLRGATEDVEAFAGPIEESGRVVLGMTLPKERRERHRSSEGDWVAPLARFAGRAEAQRVAFALQAWSVRTFLVPAGEGVDLLIGGLAGEAEVREALERLGQAEPLQALFESLEVLPPAPRRLSPEELAGALDVQSFVEEKAALQVPVPLGTTLPRREGLHPPAGALATAAAALGSVSQSSDPDGVFRRYAPLVLHQGRVYPSLALAAVLQAEPGLQPALSGGELVLGPRRLRLDAEGSFGLRFNDRAYTRIGAYEVLRAQALARKGKSVELAADLFRDKVVFVIASAAALKDIRPTPVSRASLGGEVNVVAYDNLSTGRSVRRASGWLDALVTFVLALLLALGVAAISARVSAGWLALVGTGLLLLVAAAGLWGLGDWAMRTQDLWLTFSTALAGSVGTVLFTLAVSNSLEARDRRFAEEAVGRYTSPVILRELKKDRERLSLDWGEQREVSVYFSDIANFTSFSEALEPRRLVRLLNDYLTHMTDLVLEHDGVVDKYIGDAIMAFWGAPVDEPEHARKAVRAALAIRRRCDELREKWQRDFQTLVIARAGVNTGPAIAGHMGSRHKFNFTLIGDTVNLASRLEGANKPYGTTLMVSETCLAATGSEFDARELDLLAVKGKLKPVTVYEVLAEKGRVDPVVREAVELYLEGLAAYRAQRFAEAQARFERALVVRPDDGPSKTYVERCVHFLQHPPPPDWDGVWRMKEK